MINFIFCVVVSLSTGLFSADRPTQEEFDDFMRSAIPVSPKEDVGNYIKQLEPFFPKTGYYFINTCDEDAQKFRLKLLDLRRIPQYLAVNESYVAVFSKEAFAATLIGKETVDFYNLGTNPNVSLAGTLSGWMETLYKFDKCLTDSLSKIGEHKEKIASEGGNARTALYKREPFLAYLQALGLEPAEQMKLNIETAAEPVIVLNIKIAQHLGDDLPESVDLMVIHQVKEMKEGS